MPSEQLSSIAECDRWSVVTVKVALVVAVCVAWPVTEDGSIHERPQLLLDAKLRILAPNSARIFSIPKTEP